MKNLWIQTEHEFATWIADFSAIATQPQAMLDFARKLLASGAAHRVFDVVEAPIIGYRRDRNGVIGDLLARMLRDENVLDLFSFTGAAMLPGHPQSSTVEATLCYFDRDDQLVERVVTDLGGVLSSLEPVPDSIPNGFMRHYPPVRVTGRRYHPVQEGRPVDARPNRLPVAVYLSIHSDIWFPWIFGSAHPECDHRKMFDNRELANCHTPRLNAFLADVAAAAREAGGSFGVWSDGTPGPMIERVTDQGVLLDWMPPEGIMPREALEAEWR